MAGTVGHPFIRRPGGAYAVCMGRVIWSVLGTIFAIWLILLAVGSILPLIKVFALVTLVAVAFVIVVSLIGRRRRR